MAYITLLHSEQPKLYGVLAVSEFSGVKSCIEHLKYMYKKTLKDLIVIFSLPGRSPGRAYVSKILKFLR